MPQTPKKQKTKFIDDLYTDDPDASDAPNDTLNDYGSTDSKKSPYSLRNHNHSLGSSDDAAAFPNNASPPNSLIYSKLKRKIDPRLMIKLKIIEYSK